MGVWRFLHDSCGNCRFDTGICLFLAESGDHTDPVKTSVALIDWREGIGGAEEDRTPDLRIANATLSQLSYGPMVYMPLRQQETTLLILSHDFSYIPPFEG